MMVALVAQDVSPSRALERVGVELVSRGHAVCAFLGSGNLIVASRMALDCNIGASHALLLGMSSSAELAEEEIYAARLAFSTNIPFGFYCDTYGCHNRPWFAEFRDKASFVFVINEKEAEEARRVFPKARVAVSGNPIWEDFCFPKFTKDEVRSKLGIAENEAVVLC